MEFKNKKLKEFEEYIRYRKIALIGLGVSNQPLIEYLYNKKARVTIFDERNIEDISPDIVKKIEAYDFEMILGTSCLNDLVGFDMIFRSPSCLPTRKELVLEKERGAIITTEVEMFMEMCPCKIIGITGSEGKTTTTTLISEILKKSGKKVYLGGNIGIPLFTKLSEIMPEDIVALELSSFQLMEMEISPDIAIITNITPNHLNIHKDYTEYIEAKKNIFKHQNSDGIVILNYDNEITRQCGNEVNSKVIYYSSEFKLETGYIVDNSVIKYSEDGVRRHILNTNEIVLKGKHNYENIAAAIAATSPFISEEKQIEVIKNITPVEHRLEFVREIDGVKWYNDSASSSPTRTIAGLEAFDENITLIAGGYDKNLDYMPIAKPIIKNVKNLILFGQTSKKILDAVKNELESKELDLEISICYSLEETVNVAKKLTSPGEIVLFSPASASFDMFKDFADRGRKFKDFVKTLN